MGIRLDHNFESFRFIHLNQQFLSEAGADWIHPQAAENNELMKELGYL